MIIGIYGNVNKEIAAEINNVVKNPLYDITDSGLRILAGGSPQTCFYSSGSGEAGSFIATGAGIQRQNGKLQFLNNNDWNKVNTPDDIRNLSGHFVIARWNKAEIKLLTGQSGIRDLFYRRLSEESLIFFNTG